MNTLNEDLYIRIALLALLLEVLFGYICSRRKIQGTLLGYQKTLAHQILARVLVVTHFKGL